MADLALPQPVNRWSEYVEMLRERIQRQTGPWTLELSFQHTTAPSLQRVLTLVRSQPSFRELLGAGGKQEYSAAYGPTEVLAFDQVWELVRGWTHPRVCVRGEEIPKKTVNAWLRCYRDKLKQSVSNPLFCYGASPFTFNLFGCHRTMIRDAYPQWTHNWYEFGRMTMDGTFEINKRAIAARILENLGDYYICPALSLDSVGYGFSLIPDTVDPKRDPLWEYFCLPDQKTPVGVRPLVTELVLDESTQTVSTAAGEVDVTMGVYMQRCVTPHFMTLYSKLTGLHPQCRFMLWRPAQGEPNPVPRVKSELRPASSAARAGGCLGSAVGASLLAVAMLAPLLQWT